MDLKVAVWLVVRVSRNPMKETRLAYTATNYKNSLNITPVIRRQTRERILTRQTV